MDLTVKIGFEEVLNLVKQLPASKIKQLQVFLNQDFISKKASDEISSFQNFLINAPVMTEKELDNYKFNRNQFSQWRIKN